MLRPPASSAGRRPRAGRLLAAIALAAVAVTTTATLAPDADAGVQVHADVVGVPVNPPTAQNPTNPLANQPWGVYMGWGESPWAEYNGKLAGAKPPTAAQKKVLRKIVETPKMRWFSDIMSPALTAKKVRNTIDSVTSKDPNALVQFATFGMVKTWEWGKCAKTKPYKKWANAFAGAVKAGHAHTAIVVQIDGPHGAHCAANRAMVKYMVKKLHAIPNTSIYIEMGSADWPAVVGAKGLPKEQVAQSAKLLQLDGVSMARGFALDTSHFDATAAEVKYGKLLLDQLAKLGIKGKHFVVDTSDNGAPFTGKWWHTHHGSLALDQAKPCAKKSSKHCVTLGIPPTVDVDNPAWKLPPAVNTLAAKYVDAFMWIERPWQLPKNVAKGISKAPGFKLSSALKEVRTSPWNPLAQGLTTVIGNPK